jgi:adenosylhomocysteinase
MGVYTLDKVARPQQKKLNAQLTTLTDQHTAYIGVPAQGPYKAEHYWY